MLTSSTSTSISPPIPIPSDDPLPPPPFFLPKNPSPTSTSSTASGWGNSTRVRTSSLTRPSGPSRGIFGAVHTDRVVAPPPPLPPPPSPKPERVTTLLPFPPPLAAACSVQNQISRCPFGCSRRRRHADRIARRGFHRSRWERTRTWRILSEYLPFSQN